MRPWTGDEIIYATCPLSMAGRPHLMRLRLSDGVERCAWCGSSVAELKQLAAAEQVIAPDPTQQ
jgi:hypothetical protein